MEQIQAEYDRTDVMEQRKTPSPVTTKSTENRKERHGEVQPDEPEGFMIAGFPWQFVMTMSVIAIGVLGLIAKALGLF